MVRLLVRLRPALLVLLLLCGSKLLAQTARIVGQVADEQGLAVPNAAVQVVSQDGSIKRQTTSDANGAYAVRQLPAGTYQVIVQAEGFNTTTSPMTALAADKEFVYNATLPIATATQGVTVSAAAANAVELDAASLSTTLSTKEVTGLGLNGRNFSQLIALAPGVSNQTGQDEAKVGVAGAPSSASTAAGSSTTPSRSTAAMC